MQRHATETALSVLTGEVIDGIRPLRRQDGYWRKLRSESNPEVITASPVRPDWTVTFSRARAWPDQRFEYTQAAIFVSFNKGVSWIGCSRSC
jgi:hypothetical protein